MCAPEWLHFRHGPYTYEPSAYSSDGELFLRKTLRHSVELDRSLAEYFSDLARIYREEIQDLYSRGCRTYTASGVLKDD